MSLPHEVRDRFIDVGLAHALAASGFHVSLILGAVLGISRRWGDRPKLLLGLLTLLVYVGLVGFGPSVLRAADGWGEFVGVGPGTTGESSGGVIAGGGGVTAAKSSLD